MAMACLQSQETFAPQCPSSPLQPTGPEHEGSIWYGARQRSAKNRLLLCPFMILALCYALLLGTAALHTGFELQHPRLAWGRWGGFLLFIGLQGLAVLTLSPLAGVGQRHGGLFGCVTGLATGLFLALATVGGFVPELTEPFVAVAATAQPPARQLMLIALPLVHAVCGGVGGIWGGKIWQPLPILPTPQNLAMLGLSSHLKRVMRPRKKSRIPWHGPIVWPRVAAGIVLAVLGALCASEIIQIVLDAAEGYLKLANESQHRVTVGEIFALSMLLGGAVAGASTPNGLKQGLCVGVVSGFAMASLGAAGAFASAGALPLPLIWALFLGPLGGWFGTELLPPVNPAHRPRAPV